MPKRWASRCSSLPSRLGMGGFRGSGFLGFRDLGFRVQDLGFRVLGSGFIVFGMRASGF